MSNQKTKNLLSQAYRIDQRINSKLEQARSLRELAAKANATLADMPRPGTRNVHRMEYIIAKMVDIEMEINNDIDALIDTKRAVMSIIKDVTRSEYQSLLELRYLCFKSWEQIAVDMGYELRYLHKLHGRALEQCRKQKEDTKRH